MLEQEIVITNRLGLHARASAKLVQLVQGFKSTVLLVSKGREVNAQSIMGVMMLAAGLGSPVTIRVEGPDEEAALTAVAALFERKFDEGAQRCQESGVGNRESAKPSV
jgi:phosphocarrier protein HPr